MYYYLKKGLKGVKVFDFELDTVNYCIGSTYEDYLSGAWIPLNDTHLDFIKENPKATVWEIFNLELDDVPPPIEIPIEQQYEFEVTRCLYEVYPIDKLIDILLDKDTNPKEYEKLQLFRQSVKFDVSKKLNFNVKELKDVR